MGKPITEKRLYHITLFYLSRFEASAQKVRAMLHRRVQAAARRGETIPDETDRWIEQIVQKVQDMGYVNDTRYAANRVRVCAEQGQSDRMIAARLARDGIDKDTVQALLQTDDNPDSPADEETRARHWAARKKIGLFRPVEQRATHWRKDRAALARAGFSYDTVQAVMGTKPETVEDDENIPCDFT